MGYMVPRRFAPGAPHSARQITPHAARQITGNTESTREGDGESSLKIAHVQGKVTKIPRSSGSRLELRMPMQNVPDKLQGGRNAAKGYSAQPRRYVCPQAAFVTAYIL
jgi:hypothetical protein